MDVATRYKLLEKIGAGSFATVYRAEDQELGREVAVKQIHAQFLAETMQFDRYWKEATLLASFQHPNIVTIYDVVRGQGWLILELMQANLRDRLQGRPMDLKAVQTTLTQALRALSALHSRGLVHGDIKPSNLMIDHRKRIKVGDFGLARRVSHDDGSVIRGTAKYMAPETLSQDFGDVGPQSDLYSLGFTAYELMCGSKFETLFPGLDAFGRDRQAAWMMWHAALDRKLPDPAKALENVPPVLAKVIAKLVEKDPKKRYATADQALADLGSSPGEPMTRTNDSGATKVRAKDSRPKSRGLVIAAVCASTAASLAMLFWNPDQAKVADPASKLATGIIRSVDVETRTIELLDPATGLPEELVVAEKTPIRLHAAGRDELVLLKRLQPGDWVRSTTEGALPKVDVSRPVTHEGKLASVDSLASKITVSIENQRLRDKVTLAVPTGVKVMLNGKPAPLKDLAVDDFVIVDHLLDPAGKQGEIVSRLLAIRTQVEIGSIVSFDPASAKLRYAPAIAYSASRDVTIGPQATLVFDDGSSARAIDLAPGRTIQITTGTAVTRVVIDRELPTKDGALLVLNLDGLLMTLQSGGETTVISVSPQTQVTLNEAPATLAELRPNNDRISATIAKVDGAELASRIRATRMPRFDRSVIGFGSTTNRDRSIPVLESAIEEVRRLGEIAVSRYATPPEWAQTLAEPTRGEVSDALKQRLASLRPNVQVVVAIVGQAFIADGKAVVALADYQPNNALVTGLLLSDVIAQLDAAAPTQKLLLLDVLHPRPGFEDAVPDSAEALLKDLPKPATVTVFCNVPRPAGTSSGGLGTAIAAALSGGADADKDLVVTPDELEAFLMKQPGSRSVSRWPVSGSP